MIIANHDHGHKLFISGEGKSGTVGQRMATSLTSLGMSSQFVPAVEWLHGDLGHLSPGDCVLLISHSGKNADVVNLIDIFKKRKIVVLGMCADEKSALLTKTDAVIGMMLDVLYVGTLCTGRWRTSRIYPNTQCYFARSCRECTHVSDLCYPRLRTRRLFAQPSGNRHYYQGKERIVPKT